MCLTPLISDSFCSSGKLTRFSTLRTLAPGYGTSTLAIVTSICGSSSLGVMIAAAMPSSSPAIASKGVICETWNARAMRPEMPSLAGLLMSGCAAGVVRGQPGHRGLWIARHPLAVVESGQHLDRVAVAVADSHLAQADAALADDIRAHQLAALHQHRGWYQHAFRPARGERHLHRHARVQTDAAHGQLQAYVEGVGRRVGI